jgi:Leucine Rich Repeat (LRR) protein
VKSVLIGNRTIAFPVDYAIGIISVRQAGSTENWSVLSEAIGDVVVPAGKEVRLEVFSRARFDPAIFSNLDAPALDVIEWVSTSNVTDASIEHFRHLTGLRGLALWETSIGNESLRHVGHLSNLRWLDVGDTRITDEGLPFLSELSLLGTLTLMNDRITDKGLVYLKSLGGLGRLDLMNTLITDDGIETLRQMHQLTNLRIVNTLITETGFLRLKNTLTRCRIRYHHSHNDHD